MIKFTVGYPEKLGPSQIRFPITVYKSDDGTVWDQIPGAPTDVSFAATQVLAITNDTALTSAEQLSALADMMKAQVVAQYITEAEEAVDDLAALGITYPVTINL